jgi:hypothetical protein
MSSTTLHRLKEKTMEELTIPESAPAIAELDFDSNLMMGLVGGVGAMLVSAVLWGVFTYITGFQISWMSIGVGALVGFAIRKLGKGNSLVFGISGAVLSLLGCLLGNFLFYNGVIAKEWEAPFFNVLLAISFDPATIVEIFTAAFDVRDLLFYGIAAYIGFRAAMSK